jgi:hypothetical protein
MYMSRKSKEDRQYNSQKKKNKMTNNNLQNITQKTSISTQSCLSNLCQRLKTKNLVKISLLKDNLI